MTLTPTTGFRAAIGACVAAALLVLATPTPALANNMTIQATAVEVGEQAGTSTVTITNADVRKADKVRVKVTVSGEAANLVNVEIGGGCKGGNGVANCGGIGPAQSKSFTVTVTQKPESGLKEGESKAGSIDFALEPPHAGSGSAAVNVAGFSQVSSSVSGTITDLNNGNKPLSGAKVSASIKDGDSLGSKTTGEDGKFQIEAQVEDGQTVAIKVTKKGYATKEEEAPAAGGQPVTFDLRMEKSDSGDSAPPEQQQADQDAPPDESGFTLTTWLLIILGVLLAIGGVVAIWMLMRKGKQDDDDDEFSSLPAEPPTHQLSASQTGRLGIYEGSGQRPGADNPTMIHSGPLYSDSGYSRSGSDSDLARYGSEPSAAAPTAAYGSPSAPTTAYGSPSAPTTAYGSPAAPTAAYGSPSAPTSAYGAEPRSAAYGSTPASAPPASAYGSEPRSSAYGSEPSSSFGPAYGSNPASAPPASSYGSNPASAPPASYGSSSYGSNPASAPPASYGSSYGSNPASAPPASYGSAYGSNPASAPPASYGSSYGSNPASAPPASYGSAYGSNPASAPPASYGSEPRSSSGFGPSYGDPGATRGYESPRDTPRPSPSPSPSPSPRGGSTQRYPAAERYDSQYGEPNSYGGNNRGYAEPNSYGGGRGYPEPGNQGGYDSRGGYGSGYEEQQPRSTGRRYRDDDYDDRPRSW